jgi:hypothetical protein
MAAERLNNFCTLGRLALRAQVDALFGGFTRTFERLGAWIDRVAFTTNVVVAAKPNPRG